VRQVLHGSGSPPGYCLDDRFVRGVRLLGDLGLSFDLCMRPGELGDGARLIDACPGTNFHRVVQIGTPYPPIECISRSG
jgi:predicted TIM-barrel fold metal-dependent hydrolase